jgi:hypothetical protein
MEYCNKCGNQRSENTSYCSNCGNEFGVAQAKQQEPPREIRITKSKPLIIAAIGIGLSIFLGVGVWTILPKEVPLTLNLSSKDDVTFSNDCRPRVSDGAKLEQAIKVSFFGSDLEPMDPVAIEGTWSLGNSGDCIFNSSILFPSGAENYSINLERGSSSSEVASKLSIDKSAKEIQISSDVTSYKTLQGSLTLFEDVSNDTFIDCITEGAFLFGEPCGGIRVSTSGTCSGAGGYGDIGSGAVIRVSTDNDLELGIGKLSEGEGATIVDWDSVGDRWVSECEFQWSVKVPEVETDYRVSISDRGERSYSYEEISRNRWTVELSLGQ